MDIILLGATGSIGTQTLEVVSGLPDIRVRAMTAYGNINRLAAQTVRFRPEIVAVPDDQAVAALRQQWRELGFSGKLPEIVTGTEGLLQCAAWPGADRVVNALAGSVGLRPTLAALRAKKNVALANKETLVSAGQLIMQTARENNVCVTPIDSEHSAIWQCLQGNADNRIQKIILTASGGPFRTWTQEDIARVTADDALRHPNWQMGSKITIDCATLMNKGLEVIEAHWLFNMPFSQMEVLVHPQSIVHSMVVFEDNAVMAQLGVPDMRIPIQYALTAPKRIPNQNPLPALDFLTYRTLTFEPPDMEKFPCLALALEAGRTGGTLPAVLNVVNEAAVQAFLRKQIGFYAISRILASAFASYTVKQATSYEAIWEAEEWATAFCRTHI